MGAAPRRYTGGAGRGGAECANATALPLIERAGWQRVRPEPVCGALAPE